VEGNLNIFGGFISGGGLVWSLCGCLDDSLFGLEVLVVLYILWRWNLGFGDGSVKSLEVHLYRGLF
jgi:hypothetical protein